jgi:two-component system NtrC family response regulator
MAKILIIDDDRMMCDLLCDMGTRMGHEVTSAFTLEAGVAAALSDAYEVVFLDVRLPDGNGLDALPKIRESASWPEVIIITGAGDPSGAELAIRSGAWDYIEKPSSITAIKLPFVRALQYREQKRLKNGAGPGAKGVMALKREGIIGECAKVKACLDVLAQAANSDGSVLITGETGTGKELFAWAVHENSLRSGRPFVVVDCAALPETLVESMLFGHEKGAFTGAEKAQDGMILQADGGTLVLDEVGELPLSVQKAFLRVLQEHTFRPLGGNREIRSNFRLVAATNRDLDRMVENGQFRKDLFFRVRSFTLELPPLREHPEDIKDIAMHHMAKLCERYGTGTKGFSSPFIKALEAYDWPGNVREMVHALEAALAAAQDEPTLFPDHLPIHIRIQLARASVAKEAPAENPIVESFSSTASLPKLGDFRELAVVRAEKQYLRSLMELTGLDFKEACRVSGLSRARLYALLKKYSISKDAF